MGASESGMICSNFHSAKPRPFCCSAVAPSENGSIVKALPRKSLKDVPEEGMPPFVLNDEHKAILKKHYRNTLLEQRGDCFHKTMLNCIQSSPKLNEIIACQMYCYRDLTKWPKLNRLCQAQRDFFDRLIYDLGLEEDDVTKAVYELGVVHFRYAQFGLKPHFLDLWHQQFNVILARLKFSLETEKQEFIEAFRILNNFVTATMNVAYSNCQQMEKIRSKSTY